jgi:hypothetical protein
MSRLAAPDPGLDSCKRRTLRSGLVGFEDVLLDQRRSDVHIVCFIHPKYVECDAADRREPVECRADQNKVLAPDILSRIEQSGDFSRCNVNAGNVRAFPDIAV